MQRTTDGTNRANHATKAMFAVPGASYSSEI